MSGEALATTKSLVSITSQLVVSRTRRENQDEDPLPSKHPINPPPVAKQPLPYTCVAHRCLASSDLALSILWCRVSRIIVSMGRA